MRPGENVPIEWVRERLGRFGDHFMIIGALSVRGPLKLVKVPPNVKINEARYISDILIPLVEK